MEELKKCPRCLRALLLSDFGIDQSRKGRPRRWCKSCESEHTRNRLLLKRYGITLTEYHVLYAKQNGACGVCGAKYESSGLGGLVVDHDHATGAVRGLLCQNCNKFLGLALDSTELLQKGIEYINKHKTQT